MNPKYAGHLFTELVIMLENNDKNKKEIYHELMDRLIFCGVDQTTAMCLIELEQVIVRKRKLKFDTMLYDKYWWLKEDLTFDPNQKKIFDKEYGNYILYFSKEYFEEHKLPDLLLSFAELVCLEDEATYVDITFKDKGNVKEEIDLFKSVSYDKTIKITYKDIYFRFMCAHEQVYKNSDYPDNIEKAAKAFHKNELNLLFSSKWGFKLKHQYANGKVWRSYTSEFFTKNNI